MPTKTPISASIGYLHISWSGFELILELLCQKVLNISIKHNCIVFGSMAFGAKKEITISLIKENNLKNKNDIINTINEITKLASRNHLFHSMIYMNEPYSTVRFLKRDLKSGLKMAHKKFTNDSLMQHVRKLSDEIMRLQNLCNISEDGIRLYSDTIKSY